MSGDRDKLPSPLLGKLVEDATEETFLFFSHPIPSGNLGFVDPSGDVVELELANRSLTIKQSPSLLKSNRSAGTTGAVLWKITPLIAEWLASFPLALTELGTLRSDAIIVELGCGIAGIIGSVMAPLISRYILTDQAYVAKTLRENIQMNSATTKKPVRNKSSRSLSAALPIFIPLDWETDDASSLGQILTTNSNIDLIIVCDCVYNEHLVGPLVETLSGICKLARSTANPTYILIAQQLRSDEIFEQFLQSLLAAFTVWRISDAHLPASLRPGTGYAVHLACLPLSKEGA